MPPNTVYVGRPTRWGNYEKGPDALEKFGASAHRYVNASHRHATIYARAWLGPLRGKNLACWCPLDQPCHADVLLKLANKP